MSWIGWVIISFGLIRLGISFINWISLLTLPSKRIQLLKTPFISILIPVRNEEKNIPHLLKDLICFKYPNLEVLVYDDLSTDKTGDIIQQYAGKYPFIKSIKGENLKENWQGKNYACFSLAKHAKGEFFLFLDADVRVKDGIVEKTLFYMDKYQLKLLSVFPYQQMNNWQIYMVTPLMNWILLTLLPLILVRKIKYPSLAAANGQFMCFSAKEYRQIQPHKKLKSSFVEDMDVIKLYKKQHLSVATLLGDRDIRCCMYDNLREAIQGFSKNIFHFFGESYIMAFSFAILTTLSPFVFLYTHNWMYGSLYFFIVLFIRLFVSLASKQSFFCNLLFLIPQQISFWYILINASILKRKKNLIWKDRNICLPS